MEIEKEEKKIEKDMFMLILGVNLVIYILVFFFFFFFIERKIKNKK
jgi:hypothetical protein